MKTIFGMMIMVTRLACLLLGVAVMLLSLPVGLLAATAPQGEPMRPSWQIVVLVIVVAVLLASGFLMFALVSPARKSTARRWMNAALLLLPLGFGLVLLNASRVQFTPTVLAYAITGASGWVLLLCCVSPDRKVTAGTTQ